MDTERDSAYSQPERQSGRGHFRSTATETLTIAQQSTRMRTQAGTSTGRDLTSVIDRCTATSLVRAQRISKEPRVRATPGKHVNDRMAREISAIPIIPKTALDVDVQGKTRLVKLPERAAFTPVLRFQHR
jgi:hypothetical protein